MEDLNKIGTENLNKGKGLQPIHRKKCPFCNKKMEIILRYWWKENTEQRIHRCECGYEEPAYTKKEITKYLYW